MHTRVLIAALALGLAACGGSDDASDEGTVGTTGGDEATETTDEGGDDAVAEADPAAEDEPDEPDDGLRCLPVSRCHSFANQDCTLVDEDGNLQDESLSNAHVEQACPGGRGVSEGVTECFDYVDIRESCRRQPELRHPEWPCGRTDTARCTIVM